MRRVQSTLDPSQSAGKRSSRHTPAEILDQSNLNSMAKVATKGNSNLMTDMNFLN